MKAQANLPLACALKSFSRLNGRLIAGAGVIVLFGWLVRGEFLAWISPGSVAMNPLSAVCFMAAGVSLACYWATKDRSSAFQSRLGQGLGALLSVVGLLKLGDYFLGWNTDLDQVLFRKSLETDQVILPNRMAPNTAFNFLLSGIGLTLLNSSTQYRVRIVQNLGLLIALHSLLVILGYIYGASYLYGIGSFIPMAFHTALLFLLLSAGLLGTQAEQGVVAILVSDASGGKIVRRLIPFALVVPTLLGALQLWSERRGIVSSDSAVTLMVLASIAIFTALIWLNALLLNRADEQRREAEGKLKQAYDDLDIRVRERTRELTTLNETLKGQIAERLQAEAHLQAQADEKRKLEEQFLRSQRIESIGALAGGVAHDLNNALAPILMGTQLLRLNGENPIERQNYVELINSSAQRCSQMVKQILSFARGSRGQVGPVQLRHLVTEMVKIATDTFPKAISVHSNAPKDLWDVRGDATELHQVLMNLCVNARDAMPLGGTLTLNVENVLLKAEAIHPQVDATPGPHVVVSIIDTGIGIKPEVLPRIFEPFFTTKAPEKGTGLGLSTAAGIAKRHNGFLQVESEAGKGTKFMLWLPAVETAQVCGTKSVVPTLPAGHGEMILLVDDEKSVRQLAKTTLEGYGYRALVAANGLEAIACFEVHKGEIRLLITDSDMPFLDGLNAIQAIQKLKPTIPIIVMSGTKPDTEHLQRVDTTRLITLRKPFDVEQLINSVTRALADFSNTTHMQKGDVAEDALSIGARGKKPPVALHD